MAEAWAVCHDAHVQVRPLPGIDGPRLLELLREAEYALATTQGTNRLGHDLYNGYLMWSNEQVRMLSQAVTPATLDALVTTTRHWALTALDPATKGNSLASLVNLEITAQIGALQRAQEHVQRAISAHAGVDVLLMPDTNVYLHSPQRFDAIAWRKLAMPGERRIRLVMPLLVIDEIDRAKRHTGKVEVGGKESVRDRARTTLRCLEGLFDDPAVPAVMENGDLESPEVSIALHMEERDHVRLPDADNEIVDQARSVADLLGRPVKIVTNDTGMRLRARAVGLAVMSLPPVDSGDE